MTSLTGRVLLGTADLSFDPVRDREADLATLRAGLEAGASWIDTAHAYAQVDDRRYGEKLVGEAVAGHADVGVVTKGGHSVIGPKQWDVDTSPERIRTDVAGSLAALGRDRLDCFLVHRVDLARERGQSVELPLPVLAELRDEGVIERIGLSNVTVAELDAASAVTRIDVVQNRHQSIVRQSAEVLDWCEWNDAAFLAYSPLRMPREAPPTPHLEAAARERGVSVQRLLLRGLLASSAVLSVISGATRVPTILDSVAAETEPWDETLQSAYDADLAAFAAASGGR